MSKKKVIDFSRKELGDGWVLVRGIKCKRMTLFVEEQLYKKIVDDAYELNKRPSNYLNDFVNNIWRKNND